MSLNNDHDWCPPGEVRATGWHSLSLAARLTAWYAMLSFASIASATWVLYLALSRNLDHENDRLLSDKAHVLSQILRERPDDLAEIHFELESAARQQVRVLIRLGDQTEKVRFEATEMANELPLSQFAGLETSGTEELRASILRGSSGRLYRCVVVIIRNVHPNSPIWAQLALDLTQEHELLGAYRRGTWLILAVAFVACVIGGHVIARRGMRPLQRIRESVHRISSSTLNERIPVTRLPSDLGELAITLNDMLKRLEDAFGRISRLSADMAHELRTPVGALRGEMEVALSKERTPDEYRAALEACLDNCARLSRTIDSVLFLARADNHMTPLHRETVPIIRELAPIRDLFGGLATEAGIALECEAPDGLIVCADRSLLQRALCNLVENALKHTRRDGKVVLSAQRVSEGVEIIVEDNGDGIPTADMTRVFEPFYRVDLSRSTASGGAGLGLSIVQSVVTLHGGKVDLRSEIGEGTRISLLFPDAAGCDGRQPAGPSEIA